MVEGIGLVVQRVLRAMGVGVCARGGSGAGLREGELVLALGCVAVEARLEPGTHPPHDAGEHVLDLRSALDRD